MSSSHSPAPMTATTRRRGRGAGSDMVKVYRTAGANGRGDGALIHACPERVLQVAMVQLLLGYARPLGAGVTQRYAPVSRRIFHGPNHQHRNGSIRLRRYENRRGAATVLG